MATDSIVTDDVEHFTQHSMDCNSSVPTTKVFVRYIQSCMYTNCLYVPDEDLRGRDIVLCT